MTLERTAAAKVTRKRPRPSDGWSALAFSQVFRAAAAVQWHRGKKKSGGLPQMSMAAVADGASIESQTGGAPGERLVEALR